MLNIAPADRPKVKAECLRLLVTLKLNPAKMQLISGFIDTYLRLNCWVITLCLAACWLLRLSIERLRNDQSCLMTFSIAGSLSAIALFVWTSALILYPLILMELCSLLSVVFKAKGNLKKSLIISGQDARTTRNFGRILSHAALSAPKAILIPQNTIKVAIK